MNFHVEQERLALSGVDELSNLHYILVYHKKKLTKIFVGIAEK